MGCCCSSLQDTTRPDRSQYGKLSSPPIVARPPESEPKDLPDLSLPDVLSAKKGQIKLDANSNEPECIYCLEIFDETNPMINTVCRCGLNRNYFHLACLIVIVQNNPNCPVCRSMFFLLLFFFFFLALPLLILTYNLIGRYSIL